VVVFAWILRTAEMDFAGFLFPWGMVIGVLGFLLALGALRFIEHAGWARAIWHLPLFFICLALLAGCILGLVFAP
jgi:hypothetical protein